MLFSNIFYKSKGSQDMLMRPSGVSWCQLGSAGVSWGQVGSSGTKWGQVRLSIVKWVIVGNMVRGLVYGWVNGCVIGWVSEEFGER